MATQARVVCDGAMDTTRHAQDVTGGLVLARGDITMLDIDEPHEADLINTGILRILGYPAPPSPLLDINNYMNADIQDSTPTSKLVIDPDTQRFTIVPDVEPADKFVGNVDDHFYTDTNAHFIGSGNDLGIASYLGGPRAAQLDSSVFSRRYDDRSYMDGTQIDVVSQAEANHTADLGGTPAASTPTAQKLGVGLGFNPVDNSCLIVRYWRVVAGGTSNTVFLELVRINPDTTEDVLDSDSFTGAFARASKIYIKIAGTALTAGITSAGGFIPELSATLSGPDAARYAVGYMVYEWGNPAPSGAVADFTFNYSRQIKHYTIPQHFEYTYGFIYTPSFGSGPDVRVTQKINTGHGAEGHVADDTDERFAATQGGGCIKWQDNRPPATTALLDVDQDLQHWYEETEVTVVDTTGFPSSGIIVLSDGTDSWYAKYTTLTPTSFTDFVYFPLVPTRLGVYTAGSTVKLLQDEDAIRGVFSWWDQEDGSFGIYYAYDASGWESFGRPDIVSGSDDQVFLDVGDTGYSTTIANGTTFNQTNLKTLLSGSQLAGPGLPGAINVVDTTGFPVAGTLEIADGTRIIWIDYTGKTGTTFTGLTLRFGALDGVPFIGASTAARPAFNGNGEVELTDASGFPPTFPDYAHEAVGCMIYTGTPESIGDFDPAEPWSMFYPHQRVGNILKGCRAVEGYAIWPTSTTVPHTFAAGTKCSIGLWESPGLPLEDGHSYDVNTLTSPDSQVYLATPNFIENGHAYDGWFGTLLPDTDYWTTLEAIGNSIRFAIWDHDPTEGGTYIIRLRVELGALATAAFGEAITGGVGIFGYSQPAPNSYVEWSYEEL